MRLMRRTAFSAVENAGPSRTLLQLRLRLSVDLLITLAMAALAIGLSLGYQVLRHRPPAWLADPGPR